MKLKSLNKLISLLIFFTLSLPVKGEEEINIWNKSEKKNSQTIIKNDQNLNFENKSNISNTITINNNIEIENDISSSKETLSIFGIYDPAENDFDLNMWTQTDA